MRYALLLYADVERARRTTPDEAAAELAVYAAITEELESAGVLVGGEAFMPADAARLVELREGQRHVSSVEAPMRELSGFYLVDCGEQQALDIAARMPVATHGAVEVRPLMTLPEQDRFRSTGRGPQT